MKTIKETHPDTARAYHAIANAYKQKENDILAADLYRTAVRMFMATLGLTIPTPLRLSAI